jgi:hypothetical protein
VTHQIFQLPPGLLNHTILPSEDDAHSGEISDLSLTHHERVCGSSVRVQAPGRVSAEK